MQKKINTKINLNDKELISLSLNKDTLNVQIGESDKTIVKLEFTGVLGFIKTIFSDIQSLVIETETNAFMKEMLRLNYDLTPSNQNSDYPSDHPYKRFVIYGYESSDGNYSDAVLEVVAENVTAELENDRYNISQ